MTNTFGKALKWWGQVCTVPQQNEIGLSDGLMDRMRASYPLSLHGPIYPHLYVAITVARR